MAFNNPYYQYFQQQQARNQQTGFVMVMSEQEAMNYPVAPGNSVVFKEENGPYCYVKTMGFNQFDRPTFEKYRLVKEETNAPAEPDYKAEIAALWEAVDSLKKKKRKKEADYDDDE